MIEIITQYKEDWTMFTLASLLDQSEQFRLHVYVDEKNWKSVEIRWMLNNFDNVKIYQSWWNENHTAKQMCHLKNYWQDKTPSLSKRLIFANGNRIFNGKVIGNNLPPENFFQKNLSFLSFKKVFKEHPSFKNYYAILGNPVIANSPKEVDPEFVIMNWDKLKEMDDNDLFYESYDRDRLPLGRSSTIDNKINLANNFQLMKSLMTYNYNSMPIYMNGRNDWLIQLDAIGLRDIVNYNVMLRKSYTINIQNHWLTEDYNLLPTGIQLAMPWDLYTGLIDKIPMNFRNHALNEKLLIKAQKQKDMLEKSLKTGFRLGKI